MNDAKKEYDLIVNDEEEYFDVNKNNNTEKYFNKIYKGKNNSYRKTFNKENPY